LNLESTVVTGTKPQARSRVSNGTSLFVSKVDGRSLWARRLRDLIEIHLADLGGPDNVSAAERSITRRASTLEVELERLEAKFATDGEASAPDLDLYQRTAGNLRRLLEALGLQRRARDVTPTLEQYVALRAAQKAQDGPCSPINPRQNQAPSNPLSGLPSESST
jgi:hypothetical protein